MRIISLWCFAFNQMQKLRTAIFALSAMVFATAAHGEEQRWSGLYAGANVGAGRAHAGADFSIAGVPAISGSENLRGNVLGAQMGYNWQIGWVVLGAEFDAQSTNQKASSSQTCATLVCGLLPITQTSSDQLTWFGTLRHRAGIAVGPVLAYGTFGVGFGSFNSTQTLTTLLGSVTTTSIDQHFAFVYGGGVEASIDRHWSAKVEYLYLDTGNVNTTYSLLGVGLISERSRLTESVTRVGINYRF